MKLNFWQIIGLILLLCYGAWKVYRHFNPSLPQGSAPTSTQAVIEPK